MDKYEFQIKTEQLGKLVEKKDYRTAAKIADSIDWRKTRNVGLLMQVSEVYENLERYEDSYEILNMAYDCAPIGRMIVYKMVEVAVKLGDFDEAVGLYKEFVKIAPHDLGRYALKYEIYQEEEPLWRIRFPFWRNIRAESIWSPGLTSLRFSIIRRE